MRKSRLSELALICAVFSGCAQDAGDAAREDVAAQSLFVDMTAAAGLTFVHDNGLSGRHLFPEIQGSGVAVIDYDRDGDLDLYFVQGGPLGQEFTDTPLRDRLYRNDLTAAEDGRPTLTLTDITDQSGIDARQYGMGVAAGDIDNDGWTDLYLTTFGRNELWRNNGDGTFSEIAAAAGVDDHRWSHSAAFFDYDRDGFLDLFVANYVDYRLANHKECPDATGTPDYCGPMAYRPAEDSLYRNLGNRRFERVNVSAGITARASGLGVVTADFDANGWVDVYVANDDMANQLWLNQGNGRFVNEALIRGTAVNGQGEAEASMGVDAGDVDGDGDVDLFMTHLREETNTLYINDGDGFFMDRTISAGLAAPSVGSTSFGTAFVDFDNDGRLDLPVVNGAVRAVQTETGDRDSFPYEQSNQLFRNSGSKFEDFSAAAPDFTKAGVARGLAVGDIDNDGDIDLVIAHDHSEARLLINTGADGQHWLGLRLTGASGRDMLGARAALIRPDGSRMWRRARSDASYLSANDPRVLFGLGTTASVSTVEIHWPDGSTETWSKLIPDRYHTLSQGQGGGQP